MCQVRLGVFGSECEAARAYDMAALVIDNFKADTNVSPWTGYSRTLNRQLWSELQSADIPEPLA